MRNRIKKIMAVLMLVVISTACNVILGPPGSGSDYPAVPPVSSLPSDQLIEGQPNLNLISIRGGYYVWKVNNAWHVRVAKLEGPPTSFSNRPFFSGTILVDNGVIRNVDRTNISPVSKVQYTMKDINYKIEPRNNIEGFDFTINPLGDRYCITLDLRVNGGLTPKLVHVGRSMYIVDTLPITMCVQ
ncbi:MAG: hypothetical protein A2X59_10900 [Nitrospirae bacterium GWC2_42_7]|nr:MAG: hypothetical protein A2X59_10900 [Nitrospirae bacterium GWC2_42_7]HBO83573.1 hypothetical protein [Deltaproteobacteria bacterium]